MRALQADREEAFKPLAEVLAQRSSLLEQLAALDEPYGKAYVVAEGGGWTAEELEKLGADEPVKRPKARNKGRRSATAKSGSQEATSAPEGAPLAAAVPQQDGPAIPGLAALRASSG